MKVELLTSMAGDTFAFQFGDIVETAIFVSPGGASADAIANAWIEAGIARKPADEAVLSADVKRLEAVADNAAAMLEDATARVEEIATERDGLAARVAVLEEVASGDAEKRAGELAAKVAVLEKQLSERETQLARAREDAAALLAQDQAQQQAALSALADQLTTTADKLAAAIL